MAALRLEIHCFQDVRFSKLSLNTLRMFLQGEGTVVHSLIELLCNNCIQIVARDLSSPQKKMVPLSPSALKQVGFDKNEGLMPFPRRSFWGYRLLEGVLHLPRKILLSGPLRLRSNPRR